MNIYKSVGIMIAVISSLLLFCTDEDTWFEVTVVDPDSIPIESARVEGGIDWDWFRVYTDSNGIALVPGHARGEHAMIQKDNYFPLSVERLDIRKYVLEPTPQLLRPIGTAEGTALVFGTNNLVTLDYQGDYRVYFYDNQSITEIASATLPSTMKQFKLYDDTLWFSTHDDGIYVYSLADVLQPQLLFHLNLSGYLKAFAVRDSIVAVCTYSAGPLRVFSYSPSGQFQELSTISEFIADQMVIRDNYLIIVGGETSMPTVFDLSNPAQPMLVYNGLEPGAETGLILDTMLVIVPEVHVYTNTNVDLTYKLMRLTNPANPYFSGVFYANAVLLDVIDNEYAVGDYVDFYSIAVLTGSITDRFSTVALINDAPLPDYGGSRPPYFLINNQLMILEPR